MTRPIFIAPSILSADFSRLGEQVKEAEEGGADFIHVDVMDGHFVPNITVGPLVVKAVKGSTNLRVLVHLMIERPERYLDDFINCFQRKDVFSRKNRIDRDGCFCLSQSFAICSYKDSFAIFDPHQDSS